MNGLVLFKNKAPAKAIAASELDANFKRCMPIAQDGNAAQYKVGYTPSGWYLEIFPGYPPSDEAYALTSSGGSMQWTPQSQLAPGVLPPAPASGTHVLGSINGIIQWLATESCD